MFVLLLFLCLGSRDGFSWNGDRGTVALVVLRERLNTVLLARNQTLHVPLGPGRGLVVHQLSGGGGEGGRENKCEYSGHCDPAV